MSAVTEHSTCAKNIHPHYNRSDKARERESGNIFLCLFTFPDFMSSHAIQSLDTPCLPYFRGCVCNGERPCVYVFEASILTMLLCFLPMALLVYVHMCSSFLWNG